MFRQKEGSGVLDVNRRSSHPPEPTGPSVARAAKAGLVAAVVLYHRNPMPRSPLRSY